tara:strand:+ start:1414 stop:1668 length:255 start_codon:yes stop_codon:yes gene_type:complete
MKIVLSIIICSAIAGECQLPFQNKNVFEEWSSCMYQGYHSSLELLNVMGDEYINSNKIYIKFSCKEIEEKQINHNSSQTLSYPL